MKVLSKGLRWFGLAAVSGGASGVDCTSERPGERAGRHDPGDGGISTAGGHQAGEIPVSADVEPRANADARAEGGDGRGGGAAARVRFASRALVDLLYPPYCSVCGEGAESGDYLCATCSNEADARARQAPSECARCSLPFWGAPPLPQICAECEARQPAFECVVAARTLNGAVREVVHQFKYGGRCHLRLLLADWLAEGLRDPRLRAPPPELLVPVPLHWWKRHRRGFNQAALLARELSRRTGLQVEDALCRRRSTGTQTALGRELRLENMRGAFGFGRAGERRVAGRAVLLVDDVLTTGATLDACARVLLEGGASSVRALVVARG